MAVTAAILRRNSEAFFDGLPQRSRQVLRRVKNHIFEDNFPENEVVEFANECWVILTVKTSQLIEKFIALKKSQGTETERRVFAHLTKESFVDRLVRKRPLVFMGSDDSHLLRDGTEDCGGFDHLASPTQPSSITLEEYISYDEMMVSALMGVSCRTHFINK